MELNSKVEYLTGNDLTVQNMQKLYGVGIFSEDTLGLLERVSKLIMSDPRAKEFPDVITFAFWCRKANLLKMRSNYVEELDTRIGLGVAFHIAPSNVPVNFAYSTVVALLAGNACIVRVPSKDFPQIDIICDAFRIAMEKDEDKQGNSYLRFKDRLCFIRYPRVKQINDFFSDICDTRIIWGGDNTINEIKKSPIRTRTKEISFSDRFSLVMINPKAILNASDQHSIAQAFYNDTFLSDQNACTSPRFVIWVTKDKDTGKAKEIFWKELHNLVREKYEITGVQAVDKLTKLLELGASCDCCRIEPMEDNLITRIKVDELKSEMLDYYGNSGFFIEYDANDVKDILPLCCGRLQTVSYIGIDPVEIKEFIKEIGCKGIDRVVPVGHTMDFALIWDGYDLIREMSRRFTLL